MVKKNLICLTVSVCLMGTLSQGTAADKTVDSAVQTNQQTLSVTNNSQTNTVKTDLSKFPDFPKALQGRAPLHRSQVSNGMKIGRVYVMPLDLFAVEDNFAKKVMNALHTVTRKSIVRRELLYSAGKPLDLALIDESERNLRRNRYLRVKATRFYPGEAAGTVDLLVTVQDVWTLYFNVKLEGAGGNTQYNFKWGERNFLGRRLSMELEFDKSTFINKWRQQFSNMYLFGSRWQLLEGFAFYYDDQWERIGEQFELKLVYPLFSRNSKWGFELHGLYDNNMVFENEGADLKQFVLTDGTNSASLDRKYRKTRYLLEGHLIRSFGYRVKRNYGIKWSSEQLSYQPYAGIDPAYEDLFRDEVLPQEYFRHKLSLTFSLNNFKYLKLRNFFYYGRIEDYPVGFEAAFSAGLSRKFWGSDENAAYLEGSLYHNFFFLKDHIVALEAKYTVDLLEDDRQRDSLLEFTLEYFIRNLPLGFFAFRAHAAAGGWLQNGSQLYLGAGNGLRGYQDNNFEGDRRIFFNFEYRFNPIDLKAVQFGFVVFYDIGAAWYNSEQSLQQTKFYPALGIGLRINLPQFNPDVFRFDFGWNFGNDSTKFEQMISFGYNQFF